MLASFLKMSCSSNAHYFFIFLSIFLSKVASYNEDDLSFEKGGSLEDDSDSVSDVVKKNTQLDDEVDYSENRTVDFIKDEMEYNGLKKICPFYKHGKNVDYDTICDVWQVVYYELAEDLLCFKFYIKKVSKEEKVENAMKYGTFSSKVNWTNCDLEVIQGGQRSESMRRHFLQRVGKGVMLNAIILDHPVPWQLRRSKNQPGTKEKANSTYSLHPESPDQWLVVNNLLLMRDCLDGDVVVFARVPHQPRRSEIEEALAVFGEFKMKGKLACN